MKKVRSVDIIVDIDIPASGFYTDESMDGPVWGTLQVSQTFFGREGWTWIRSQVQRKHLYLDGEQLVIPRGVTNDYEKWRLIDIERFAHALAENGYLSVEQLYRVLDQVRSIAESWGYLPPKPIPTRTVEHDPTRKDIYAVGEELETTDDLDGSKEAREHSFVLDGVPYSVDLTDRHWQEFLAAVGPWVKVAKQRSRTDDPALRADRTKVRAWAVKNGHQVGKRGRIPQATMNAYLTRRNR